MPERQKQPLQPETLDGRPRGLVVVTGGQGDEGKRIIKLLQNNGFNIFSGSSIDELSEIPKELIILVTNKASLDQIISIADIRKRNQVPVIVLSENVQPEIPRILDSGADDCMDFSEFNVDTEVLEAKSNAILRRTSGDLSQPSEPRILYIGNLEVDFDCRTVRREDGEFVDLSVSEWRLLYYLAEHRDKVISTDQIVNGVWGENYGASQVRGYVARLRSKTEDFSCIRNFPGYGYMLRTKKKPEVSEVA